MYTIIYVRVGIFVGMCFSGKGARERKKKLGVIFFQLEMVNHID